MPVPASINDLSTTAASNSPGGGENPFPDLDNHIRAAYSFIASLRDGKLDASTVSAFMLTVLNDADAGTARTTLGAVGLTGNETIAGVKTFSSSPVVPSATTSGQAVNKGQLDAANVFASSAENAAGTVENKHVDPLGVREALNATGTAPVYACRAWVHFNGNTGAITASGNVASVSGTGGAHRITFTNAMPDANYAVIGSAQYDETNANLDAPVVGIRRNTGAQDATYVDIVTASNATQAAVGCSRVTVAIFR